MRVVFLALLAIVSAAPARLSVTARAGRIQSQPANDAGLIGRVTDRAGRPLAGVQIQLIPQNGDATDARSATSDTAGRFACNGLSAGLYQLEARHVGFEPVSVEFELADSITRLITIRMEAIARLDTIVTRGTGLTPPRYGPSSRMDDFYESMHRGLGKFFTREKMDSMPAVTAADVVSGVPGMRVKFATTPQGPTILVDAV